MAEQVLPQAIQYTNTGSQYLYKLAENARAERIKKEQLEYEDYKRKEEVFNSLDPTVLNKEYDAQVVNRTVDDLRNNVAQWYKQNPNANSTEFKTYVQSQLQKVSQWSNNVKKARENIKAGLEGLDKNIYDHQVIEAKALDAAIYKVDQNGYRSLRSADEIDPAYNYVGAITTNFLPEVINKKAATDMLDNKIKDAPMQKESVTVRRQRGNHITSSEEKVNLSNFLYWDDEANAVDVKRDIFTNTDGTTSKGFVHASVYNQFVQNPALDGLITRNAQELIASINSNERVRAQYGINPDQELNFKPETVDIFKRAWLTNYLKEYGKREFAEKEADLVKPIKVTINPYGDGYTVGGMNKKPTEAEYYGVNARGIKDQSEEVMRKGKADVVTMADGSKVKILRVDHVFGGGGFVGATTEKADKDGITQQNKKLRIGVIPGEADKILVYTPNKPAEVLTGEDIDKFFNDRVTLNNSNSYSFNRPYSASQPTITAARVAFYNGQIEQQLNKAKADRLSAFKKGIVDKESLTNLVDINATIQGTSLKITNVEPPKMRLNIPKKDYYRVDGVTKDGKETTLWFKSLDELKNNLTSID